MLLSLVIPAKDKNDPKLSELLKSIEAQVFPKDQMEVLVITEGTSESAKAIGIRRAKGEVIGILAADNVLTYSSDLLRAMYSETKHYGATYIGYYRSSRQFHSKGDSLNRYFALIGGNDPLSFYMGKNDKVPHWSIPKPFCTCGKTLGDNGFFVLKEWILKTDLDNYYHIDNANETGLCAKWLPFEIVHNTGGNIFKFFAKRYHYGLQHAFNKNRRWHLVDFSKSKDIWRLLWFIFVTLTVIEPLCLSIRGYLKVRDVAWFLHPLVCLMTLFTYGLLALNLGIKRLFRLLSAPMGAQRA